MEQLIGQIAIFPWDWAPRDWAKCDGQLLSIDQNTALFALIGTEFGGNGKTNFALPRMAPDQNRKWWRFSLLYCSTRYLPIKKLLSIVRLLIL